MLASRATSARADELATDGKRKDQSLAALDRQTVASQIRRHTEQAWRASPLPDFYTPPTDFYSGNSRKEERAIAQLRAGKSPLTQGYFDFQTPTLCTRCRWEPESVQHLLHVCPVYNRHRLKYHIAQQDVGDAYPPPVDNIYTNPERFWPFLQCIHRSEPIDPRSNVVRPARPPGRAAPAAPA